MTPNYSAMAVLIAIGIPTIAAADPSSGSIKICRLSGIIDATTHKAMTIPAGSTFAQMRDEDHQEAVVKTIGDAIFSAHANCVTIAAEAVEATTVNPSPGDPMLPQFLKPTSDVSARVAAGFR